MFLQPMLLEKREKPFDDERYIFEPKIDGHRMIVSIQDGKVRLFTRHENDVTMLYPELQNVPIDDDTDTVLDGEVARIDPETGLIDFELIQERFRKKKPMAIRQAAVQQPVIFFAFDILRYKGKDLRNRPLSERKKILAAAMEDNRYFNKLISIEGAGNSMFTAIREKKMEGIVAKRIDSHYLSRRDPAWQKIINYSYVDVEIAGYRKNQFGWLLQYKGRPVGILEFAVPATHKKAFYGVSKSIVTGEDFNYVYVEPSLKARVRFRNWYRSGMLRAPEFVDFVG